MREKKIQTRSLVALIVTWAFAIATITGLVLYVVPHGRVAYWVHWRLAGLSKDDWSGVHMAFGLVFIVAGVLHLYFNWKPLKNYLARRVTGHLRLKAEFVVATVFTALLLVAAILHWPPVSWLFDLNERVKDSWVQAPQFEPPFGHAERVSLAEFTRRQGIDLQRAVTELEAQGIGLSDPRNTLENIAQSNDTTPMALYASIRKLETATVRPRAGGYSEKAVERLFGGRGAGRRTVAEVAAKIGIPTEEALSRLKAVAIDATAGDQLKSVADRQGTTPLGILKVIAVPSYRLRGASEQ